LPTEVGFSPSRGELVTYTSNGTVARRRLVPVRIVISLIDYRSRRSRAMRPRPLHVLIVAADRTLLRHLSKFLGVFGYRVDQAAGIEQARAALERSRPEFLLIDEDLSDAANLCREAVDEHSPYIYSLLLSRNPAPGAVTDALESGFDDFLAKPVVYGELLARLRAGARLREFERRWREQAGVEPVTGLPNRGTLLDRLASQSGATPRKGQPASCVLFDVDYFGRIAALRGNRAAESALQTLGRLIVSDAGEAALTACFGGDRFAVLLPNRTDVEAVQWAEELRQEIARHEFGTSDDPLSITVSAGVADCELGPPALLDVVDQAEQALEAAKSSGRDCVLRWGQHEEEAAAWADLAAPGRLFEHTVARDVMTPCTATLRGDDPVDRAAALLEQTGLFAVPVVDGEGKLAGVITQETDWNRLSGSWRGRRQVREVMNTHPPCENEFTSFSALVDFFAADSGSLLVIVDGGRPTGLVTRDNLAALSEPLTTASFSPHADEPAHGSRYLLVAEACTAPD
jgi:diguanylate cyclase (GGDEF)-like protein